MSKREQTDFLPFPYFTKDGLQNTKGLKPLGISKETLDAMNKQVDEMAKPPKHLKHLGFDALNKVMTSRENLPLWQRVKQALKKLIGK